MSEHEPQPDRDAVCDTVVLNYFLAIGEFELLSDTLGRVQISRAVFDPQEPEEIADEAASELRRGLRLHHRRSTDDEAPLHVRSRSARALPHFTQLPQLCSSGQLIVLEMTRDELTTYTELRNREHVRRFGLIEGLGRGEAATISLAVHRNLDVATDDQDAIRVITQLAPNLDIRRIRSILTDAVARNLVAPTRAQEIHLAMRQAGFWDTGTL